MKEGIALILLFIYTLCEYTAYVPQIVKLVKTKSADDLSILTWLTWVVASICYLAYILLECPETGIIFVASMNIIFVVSVCLLTTYYQINKKLQKQKRIKTKR